MGEAKRREIARKKRLERVAGKPQASLLEILDAWDLLTDSPPVSSLTLGEWALIGEAVQNACSLPMDGREHRSVTFGLNLGAGLADGRQPLDGLMPYSLMFDSVWLPDPIFSALSPRAAEIEKSFGLARQSFRVEGSYFYFENLGSIWNSRAEDQLRLLRMRMPSTLARIRALRGLIESDAIRLAPWEPVAQAYSKEIAEDASALVRDSEFRQLTEAHPQREYSMGLHIGPMDFAGPDKSPRWVENKDSIVMYGLLNTVYAVELGSQFVEERAGDRAIFDHLVVSEGRRDIVRTSLIEPLYLPKFSAAVLPDVARLRQDSEALVLLRSALETASAQGADTDEATKMIAEQLREAGERLRQETGLWRLAKDSVAKATIGLVSGAVGRALDGSPLMKPGLVVTSALGVAFNLVSSLRKRRLSRGRAELLIRVADRTET